MRIINAIWWRHAYVFSVSAFLQALWITLQLRHHWSNYWYGILLPSYVAIVYWAGHLYMVATFRGDDHHRHNHSNNRLTHEYDARESWDASPDYSSGEEDGSDNGVEDRKPSALKSDVENGYSSAPRKFEAANLYRNDDNTQEYTKEELRAGAAYHQTCNRDPDESLFSYRLRRALDAQQLVRISCLATAVTQVILLAIKLDEPDSLDWWVWWLVASIMTGITMLFSVIGAFWVPLRAWYMRAYIEGQRSAILAQRLSPMPSGYVDGFLGSDTRGLSYKL